MMAEKWIDVSPKDVIWDNIDVRTLVILLLMNPLTPYGVLGRGLRDAVQIRDVVDRQPRAHCDMVRAGLVRRYSEQCDDALR